MKSTYKTFPEDLKSIIRGFWIGPKEYYRSKMKLIFQTNKQRYDNWLEDRMGLVRETEFQCKSSIWAWIPELSISKEKCKALGYPTHMLGYLQDPIQWYDFLDTLKGRL